MSKILYVASTMSHINNFHQPYIRALRSEGHEVLTMAKGAGADYDIPFVKKLFSHGNAECRRQIKKIVADGGFDAVVLNTSLAAFHVRFAIGGKRRPKVINIVHGYLFDKKAPGVKDKILLLCEKILAPKTDKLLVMNEDDLEIAKKHKLSKSAPIEILGMGAVAGKTERTSGQVRAEMLSEGKYVMCFVGELSERKNQRQLISALSEIKLHIPEAMLWLVGDGELKRELIDLAEELHLTDSVVFAGKRHNPCDFIRAADLYVSASKIEGMPFNIIEALGSGATVLCSDIKGHRDLVHDGEEGFLFPLDSQDKLVESVLAIYRGERVRDERAAYATYDKYSFDNVFDKTLLAIKEAIND